MRGSIKRSDFNDYKVDSIGAAILVENNLHRADSYPGPLGQLIVNFFTNALAHAFPVDTKGNIWISCARTTEDTIKIEFRDDGCGIPDANIGRVFDPFFTTRLGQGGSGLGLSIAFNIATGMLGGTLELVSAQGQGTTFTVLLPRVAPNMAAVER
jgi:signal transduction histidine kinase